MVTAYGITVGKDIRLGKAPYKWMLDYIRNTKQPYMGFTLHDGGELSGEYSKEGAIEALEYMVSKTAQ